MKSLRCTGIIPIASWQIVQTATNATRLAWRACVYAKCIIYTATEKNRFRAHAARSISVVRISDYIEDRSDSIATLCTKQTLWTVINGAKSWIWASCRKFCTKLRVRLRVPSPNSKLIGSKKSTHCFYFCIMINYIIMIKLFYF